MDPAALAQQATEFLIPYLPFIYAGGKAAADKSKEMLVEGGKAVAGKSMDMLLEKSIEKVSPELMDRAKSLLKKLSPRMSESLQKALEKLSRNSEDPKAQEELQQEILRLLRQDPDLAREIESIIINFNVENVDQLTVGSGNSPINIKNQYIQFINYPEGINKEKANQNNSNQYNPSTLPEYSDTLKQFVTENRAGELSKALTYIEKHKILLFSGVGGVGKSTLARAHIDLRPIHVPEPFWFNFNQNQDAKLEDILEKLASYMNSPEIASFKDEKREPEKIDVDRLTDELQRRGEIWLIFDDLSTVLEDQRFTDKGIELLFSSLRYNTHNAKIIITSRILPILANGESLLDVVEDEEKQDIKGLETNFAVDYLYRNGLNEVEPEKLKELAEGVDGHPLALKLLVKLVKEFGARDILDDLSMYQKDKEDTIKKARKLFYRLAGEEIELLECVSVYREPVSMKGLKEMFSKNTPPNAVKKLIDKSLLETDHTGNYWLHPLVQEFSYEDLKNKKEAHMLAVKYYLYLTLPENPTKKEDLQPAIEAHHHACKAGEYDLAASILWGFNIPHLLDLWGNPRTLIEIYEKLLPGNHFKDEPILKDKQAHGAVLGNMGNAYSHLGEPRKAIEYYEQGLRIAKEIGDRRVEGDNLGNKGNAYSHLGEFRKAIEYYEKALKISKEIKDRSGEGNHLGNIGSAYYHLGEPRKAIEYYKQALKIYEEIGDKRGEGNNLGNMGLAYSHLGELREAIEYYGRAMKISKEIGSKYGEGNQLGNIGNVYSDLGEPRKAIEYYEQALRITRETGDRHGEGNHLGNMGTTYSDLGEPRKAIEYYENSLKIAREIGDRHGEGNLLGNMGLAYSDLGEPKRAIEYYEQALSIAREIGDRRGEGNQLVLRFRSMFTKSDG